jgi:hypothetical protein
MPNNVQYLHENQDHKLKWWKNMLSEPIEITIAF